MSKRRLFRYSGNKLFLSNRVNQLIKEHLPDYLFYIEPFLGSGSIFYNLDSFEPISKTYLLSDVDPYIISMHKASMLFSYEQYRIALDYVQKTFGDIKTDKDAYYAFRKYYNEHYDAHEAPLYLLMLANSCINSMLRFGPNGMNQSFGHRHYIVDEDTWNSCGTRIRHSNINQSNYKTLLSCYEHICPTVYFLDPPYASKEMTYNRGFDRTEFIDFLKRQLTYRRKESLTLYTDIENEESDSLLKLGWEKETIRTMRTTCPSKSSEITGNEVLYYKITK